MNTLAKRYRSADELFRLLLPRSPSHCLASSSQHHLWTVRRHLKAFLFHTAPCHRQENSEVRCGGAHLFVTYEPARVHHIISLYLFTANQLRTANSDITSVCVADVELPVAIEIKVLGVVLDRRLAFDKHVLEVTRSCNFHAQTIRHIRHLLSTDLHTR